MGLEAPDGGRVCIPEGTRFSAVFQEDRLLNRLTAAGNVRLAARVPAAQAEKLLLALGIPAESLSQPVSAFSGGMMRRVALCRALLAEYDVLTLDEPYKGPGRGNPRAGHAPGGGAHGRPYRDSGYACPGGSRRL